MSKRTGPTRIPVFGPRIPVPVPVDANETFITTGQNLQHDTTVIQRKKAVEEVSAKDIGKKVRVADKEGILRFVGNVHFTTGVWCGVELASALGKNDGVVRGVRYFTCPASRGLMAPLSKVSLIDEIAEDAASGPYSMIFDANDQLVNNTYTNIRLQDLDGCYDLEETPVKDNRKQPPLAKSDTFDKTEPANKTASIPSIRNANNITFIQNDNATNTTQIKCDTVVNIPQNNSISEYSILNESGDTNETIINISITKRRFFNITDTDKEVLNTPPSKDLNKTSVRGYDNVTFDVKSDNKSLLNTTVIKESAKHKAPSDLNLRSFSCNETVILKNINESFDRPKSYPITDNYFSPIKASQQTDNITHSTALRKERETIRGRSLTLSPTNHNIEDDNNKRDSLDFDESLGILTPDQMVDNLSCFITSRSPSSENIPSLLNDVNVMKYQKEVDVNSPNVADSSLKDYSLGVIDVNAVSTLLSDTTMNMELPLDTDNNKKDFILTRIDQTPSPEELPLDPTPISVEDGVSSALETKTEPTQSKTTSNFITSITSITSIDTGYQGDGEMSRPASRGPDNSPLTRRPLARPQPRRPDPMTDSDFYTESDADNHEEHPLRGDRRAQVIDGTLYGVDPQAAADIYVNNRENMDSSGIFTDLESNIRTEELSSGDNDIKPNQTVDVSPSDSSTKTISDNSQHNILIMSKTSASLQSPDSKNVSDSTVKEISPKRHTPSPSTATSSPTSVRSPRHTNKDEGPKKYKMPKRNVASKVKAMLEPANTANVDKKKPTKKPIGRWDAVMNKISKSQDQNKSVVKEIKSKVFATITTTSTIKIEPPKASTRPATNQKSPSNKLRRVRSRATSNATSTKNTTTANIQSSIHSSLSDLSAASPVKKGGSAKKQREVVRVTQVLTAAKLSPKPNNRNSSEVKKPPAQPIPNDVKIANRKNLFASKESKKKEIPTKECSRTTTKGGRVSPGTRPPQQQRAAMKAPPRTAEALAILVQHLVFNLEAFRVPSLRKEVEKVRLDAEDARLSCLKLEEKILEERSKHTTILDEESARYRTEIAALREHHRNIITELKNQHSEAEQRLKQECQDIEKRLTKTHEEKLQNLRQEYNRLQKAHAEMLDILREENDAIREEIDNKNSIIDKLKSCKFESEKLKKDYEVKELSFKEQLQRVTEENFRLKDENETLLNYSKEDGNSSIQEVQSLRAVLELKLSDVADLRKSLAKASAKAEQLPIAEEKIASLTAKCEDLLTQLERKNTIEQQIMQDKSKLEESFIEEVNQNKRLKQRNEELQWKVQQNREILNRICEQAEESGIKRSTKRTCLSLQPPLERTPFFKEKISGNKTSDSGDVIFSSRSSKNSCDVDMMDFSPPSSPKVKGVVEKSDSVSYVLEMDESPDVAASRILRRSFRNSTPPKNTPTKSPSGKTSKLKGNPLSLSASTSAIIPTMKTDHMRSRSISVRNGEYDNNGGHADDIFVWEPQMTSSTPSDDRNSCERSMESFKTCVTKYKMDESERYRSCDLRCNLEDHLDFDDEHDVDIKLPSLPSEIGRNNDIQSLPVPRHLAGEAMISENTSDDESTSSSSAQL